MHRRAPARNDENGYKKYCIYVATEFEEWKYTKMKNTTDILFCALLQYVCMMRLFLALKRAIRCGDAIAIETAYNDFLPYFEAAGKSNYVEIVLNQTDQYYKVLSKRELHLLRCNRTARLYGGKSKVGYRMLNGPLMD